MSLPPEVEASFITIIDSILAASDLDTISEKRIRKGLQASVQYDITPQKAWKLPNPIARLSLTQAQSAIKALIMARFDRFDAQRKSAAKTNGHSKTVEDDVPANSSSGGRTSPPTHKKLKPKAEDEGHSDIKPTPCLEEHKQESDDDDDELSDIKDSPPPKKKKKVDHDSDAAYAAELQAQENSRIRSTRGGGPRATLAKKKKVAKKKTSTKIKAEDDSDLEGSGSEVKEKKVNRTGGFHKELILSPALSSLLDNEVKLSRPQTVKRIWAYVRANSLQDPSDKRMIRCDDAMRAVFKHDKVHMFTMNKLLSQNMYNMDE